ncbi:peptidase M16 [Geomonas limicola]|uniref:Peptidase M16 n=1 Tax=Geomonas limicola TaxID=2740186 RepID=A0A6V8NIL2_9BACT|nr:pitrilysin family protein [Geomonas limicola]GFO70749.1 peptidase M16 [Geomonas limicola]
MTDKLSNLPKIHQSELANGTRIITQPTPGLQGAAIAIHVLSGSRDEDPRIGGASHFIEHLLFKGTKKRSSYQITTELDAIGAQPNACTSQEGVTYYLKALSSDLPQAFDVLSDMFLNSNFPEKEIEMERGVVLEEIKRAEDNPDRFLHNRFASGFWAGHPLGRPVLGTPEVIGSITREQLMQHMQQRYVPKSTVVAAAGNIEHDNIVSLIESYLGSTAAREPAPKPPLPAPAQVGVGCARHNMRDMQQVQFYLGYPSLPPTDSRYWSMQLLRLVLGGGMSSRLFREVREERGLAYSVGAYLLEYSDRPAFVVVAGCNSSRAQEAIDVCHREVLKLAKEKLTSLSLDDAKRQARGKLLLSLDDPADWLIPLAKEVGYFGRARTMAEELEQLEAVSPESIVALAEELFTPQLPRLESIGPDMELTLPS